MMALVSPLPLTIFVDNTFGEPQVRKHQPVMEGDVSCQPRGRCSQASPCGRAEGLSSRRGDGFGKDYQWRCSSAGWRRGRVRIPRKARWSGSPSQQCQSGQSAHQRPGSMLSATMPPSSITPARRMPFSSMCLATKTGAVQAADFLVMAVAEVDGAFGLVPRHAAVLPPRPGCR